MLYVTIGLATMFGVGAVVGLAAIDRATGLVFEERLATAYTTAAIIERDFARLAANVRSIAALQFDEPALAVPQIVAERILADVGTPGEYPFFSAVSVCLGGAGGELVAEAGAAVSESGAACAIPVETGDPFRVVGAAWDLPGATSLGDLIVPIDARGSAAVQLATLRLVSRNQSVSFDPTSFGAIEGDDAGASQPESRQQYTLEIIDQDGLTRLVIGRHEHFGAPSPHFAAIRGVMAEGGAAALVHPGDAALEIEPHVMAVVPLADTPFYLLLEQPTDVALALPNELRQELIVLVIVGFAGAASVAWITTRRVVQPTARLTSAAERMGRGDLSVPITAEAQDEVAVLAATLETMRIRLRDALDQLETTNRELEERVTERTERLGLLLRKMITAQEDERHALARELHDDTAQSLAALSIALDGTRDELRSASPTALAQLRAAKEIAARLLDDTRRLILGLRPSQLDDLGLGPAIAWYAESTLASRGIEIRLTLPSGTRLSPPLETALFRLAQEAINNVAKHARAKQVEIRMEVAPDRIRLTIRDDGVGFSVAETLTSAPRLGSVGLAGMQERVALLGGRLDITSSTGGGSLVSIEVPVIGEEAG